MVMPTDPAIHGLTTEEGWLGMRVCVAACCCLQLLAAASSARNTGIERRACVQAWLARRLTFRVAM